MKEKGESRLHKIRSRKPEKLLYATCLMNRATGIPYPVVIVTLACAAFPIKKAKTK